MLIFLIDSLRNRSYGIHHGGRKQKNLDEWMENDKNDIFITINLVIGYSVSIQFNFFFVHNNLSIERFLSALFISICGTKKKKNALRLRHNDFRFRIFLFYFNILKGWCKRNWFDLNNIPFDCFPNDNRQYFCFSLWQITIVLVSETIFTFFSFNPIGTQQII